MREDPTGFVGKSQALPLLNKLAEDIAKEVDQLLREDPLTSSRMEAVAPSTSRILNDDEIPF